MKRICNAKEELQVIAFNAALVKIVPNARKELKMTKKQLAEKCGLNQPYIAKIESLSTSPRVDTLVKILYHLGYKLEIVPIDKPRKA
jgi:predicted transcriptional regulator